MTHGGAQQNNVHRSKQSLLILQPSKRIGGAGNSLPVDLMTDQLNFKDDEVYGNYMYTVESTMLGGLLERPPTIGDAENIEENMEINGMMNELFSLSQTVGDISCNKNVISIYEI